MLKATLAVLVLVASSPYQGGIKMPYKISIDPNPLTGGKPGKVVTNAPEGTKVKLEWDPGAEPTEVFVDKNGEATFTVPNVDALIATVDGGGSDAASVD